MRDGASQRSEEIRVGLRALDEHASWREVYVACHVQVGVDE